METQGFTLLGIILGMLLGSLGKALADRSLTNRSFMGRSYCESCKKTLKWYDLFPIFSYLFLKGKCRYCKKGLSLSYLFTEVITAVLVGFLFYQASFRLPLVNDYFQTAIFSSDLFLKVIVITVMVIITLTDVKETIIPDRIVYPAALISLITLIILTAVRIGYLYYTLSLSVIGKYLLPPHSNYFYNHSLDYANPLIYGIVMALCLGLFFLLLILITKGRGMGGGDLKLGVFMGLVLGFPGALVALMLSFLTGAVFGILMILIGKKKFGQTIPFGPFLALGSLLVVYYGQEIWDFYLKFSIS